MIATLPAGRFTPIALNLTGATPLTPDGVTTLVGDAADGPLVLAGYSMGGRLALHAALAIPQRIARLVLISTSPGIEDAGERSARRAADDALAAQIERGTIAEFVERWRGVPLFAHDPDWVHDEVAADELAAALRSLGVGAMTPMWDRLSELRMPVEVVVGADDAAYEATGRRLAASIGNATVRAVAGVGHRVVLQAPHAVVDALVGA